jgi:transcription elongation factor SPT6
MRILTNEDLEKVDAIETFEELKDRELHFKLHYSKDNEAMQEWSRKKKQVRKASKLNDKSIEKLCFVNLTI